MNIEELDLTNDQLPFPRAVEIKKISVNKIEYNSDMYRLKILYSKIMDILGFVCVRKDIKINKTLNRAYVLIDKEIDATLKKRKLKKLKNMKPKIFKSIIGDMKTADIIWEQEYRPIVLDFFAEIEKIFIVNGLKNYGYIPEEMEELFKEIDKIVGVTDVVPPHNNNSFTTNNEKKYIKSILIVTPKYANFEYYWIVINHDYEYKHRINMLNKHSGIKDGVGYKLWQLYSEEKTDFDRGFLDYMNCKLTKVKAFRKYRKTKVLRSKNKRLIMEPGIEIEKESLDTLNSDIIKYFK